MKRFIFIVTVALLGFSGFSQVLKQEMVPQKVQDRLHYEFPQSVDLPVAWSKESGNYKAKLTIMENPAVIVIDSLGKPKRIERTINPSYLPGKTISYLKKLDPEYKVTLATKIVDEKGAETYKIAVKLSTNMTFDGSGKVVETK